MTTAQGRLLEAIAATPDLTEAQLAVRLYGPGPTQQRVNGTLRAMVAKGLVVRLKRGGVGPFGYRLGDGAATSTLPVAMSPERVPGAPLSEDAIKEALRAWLEREGWECVVKMGHERGIDIEARRGAERWVIEVKGPGSLQPMRVNYFLAILGETLQRMDDPRARYSVALPDLPQFRGLWERLPRLAKERTTIDALFVGCDEDVCSA